MDRQSTYHTFDRITPALEPVTLRSRQASAQSSFTTFALPRAKRRRLKKDGKPLSSQDVKWVFSQKSLDSVSAPAPKVGDQIGDALGGSFVIEKVENKLFGNVWECDTFRQKGT